MLVVGSDPIHRVFPAPRPHECGHYEPCRVHSMPVLSSHVRMRFPEARSHRWMRMKSTKSSSRFRPVATNACFPFPDSAYVLAISRGTVRAIVLDGLSNPHCQSSTAGTP